ncbi:universal stress protein [Fulvivirgaceae bacterium BMA10]|uniref:Universal stress protein n=2 Tax=Splendidivirga corallicola TaxID=3051826 RepID=A0ABT8KNV1_9BACT|nr:universal stress protein [Fulvivirgaceae bacterium BMA10]
MKKQKVKAKYNLLVLMDFSMASYSALRYAIMISKLVKANIRVFHVAIPDEVITSENQTIALKAINSRVVKIEDKLSLIHEIVATEGISTTYQYSFGNIIKELKAYVDFINPDLVIVGKKKEKPGFSGKLTGYLLNKYTGSLLIVNEEEKIQQDKGVPLNRNGVETLERTRYQPALENVRDPMHSLSFLSAGQSTMQDDQVHTMTGELPINEKDFNIYSENQERSIFCQKLIHYISKKNIEMLCVGREKQKNWLQNLFFGQNTTMSEVIERTNSPILITGLNR